MAFFSRFCTQRSFLFVLVVLGISFSVGLSGCSSPKPAAPAPAADQGTHRYPMTGRVVSIDKSKQQVTVDAADIPGFMMAMTMGYSVKATALLDTISPEDQIKADVVVNGDDVWLENIVVTKKADPAKAPAAGGSQPASPQSKP